MTLEDLYKTEAWSRTAIAYRHQGKVLAVATLGRDKTSLRVEAAMAAADDGAIEAALRG